MAVINYHWHPDGIVWIRNNAGLSYSDTPANLATDAGINVNNLPSPNVANGEDEVRSHGNDLLVFLNRDGIVRTATPTNPQKALILGLISNISTLIQAQATRLQPAQPTRRQRTENAILADVTAFLAEPATAAERLARLTAVVARIAAFLIRIDVNLARRAGALFDGDEPNV